MRICLLNFTQLGSTGQIVHNLADELQKQGHKALCVFGLKKIDWPGIDCLFTFKNQQEWNTAKVLARCSGKDGFVNSLATKRIVRKIAEFKPDVIHFHNMHGEWIDIRPICAYAKANGIPLLWTAHDCYLATGRCAYFSFNGCQKYKSGCGKCPFRKAYPKLYGVDRSAHYWKRKREILDAVNAVILTPSRWLKETLEGAGIKNEICVVGNPIDSDAFRFNGKHANSSDKKNVGFCAFGWNEPKGFSFALELTKRLLSKGVGVTLVGLSHDDNRLPKGAKAIARTNDKEELADFYRGLSVFVNPTMQDVFSMVNVEAIAVGTPVVTFASGGANEMIEEGVNGYSVRPGDIDALEKKVLEALDQDWDYEKVSSTASGYDKENFIKTMLPFYLRKKN
jgi:putative colanic acid biosynthesis glycosyltransferase